VALHENVQTLAPLSLLTAVRLVVALVAQPNVCCLQFPAADTDGGGTFTDIDTLLKDVKSIMSHLK
jgi:hypothetical protein